MNSHIKYFFNILVLFFIFGCSNSQNNTKSKNNNNQEFTKIEIKTNQNLRKLNALMYGYSDISYIYLNINGSIPYVVNQPLEYNSTTSLWTTSVNMLPLEKNLNFVLLAYNSSDEAIFRGDINKTLSISDTNIKISLISTENNILLSPPNLIKVNFEDNISTNLHDVEFIIFSEYNTTVDLILEANTSGFFTSPQIESNLTDGNNSIIFEYVTSETSGGNFQYKLTIDDKENGVKSTESFEIQHKQREIASDISLGFAPVVNNIIIENNLTNITIDLNVSDDNDTSNLNYYWQYYGTGVSVEEYNDNMIIVSYDENFTSVNFIVSISDNENNTITLPINISHTDMRAEEFVPTENNESTEDNETNETEPSSAFDENLSQYILNIHNQWREDVDINDSNISWNNSLAGYAQEWADTCNNQSRKEAGEENLSLLYGELVFYTNANATFDDVEDFAPSYLDYDISTNSCSNMTTNCENYKQFISSLTWEIGCGFKTCEADTRKFTVCNYNAKQDANTSDYVNCKIEDEITEYSIDLNSSDLKTFLSGLEFSLTKVDLETCILEPSVSTLEISDDGEYGYLSNYQIIENVPFTSSINNKIEYINSTHSVFKMSGTLNEYKLDFEIKIKSKIKKDNVEYLKAVVKIVTQTNNGTFYKVHEYWLSII
jgi:hypothetical protein